MYTCARDVDFAVVSKIVFIGMWKYSDSGMLFSSVFTTTKSHIVLQIMY